MKKGSFGEIYEKEKSEDGKLLMIKIFDVRGISNLNIFASSDFEKISLSLSFRFLEDTKPKLLEYTKEHLIFIEKMYGIEVKDVINNIEQKLILK
jgi:hypothetical protein